MKLKKYILSTFVLLGAMAMLTGCGGEDKTIKVLTCTPKDAYNANNSLEFVVDNDNPNVIKKIIYQEGYTEAYMDKWFPELDKEVAFEQASKKAESLLALMMTGNEHIEWIDGNVSIDKENYKISTRLKIDLSHEDFEANEETLKYLSQLGFDKYYNEDEKRFEVDPAIIEKSSVNSWIPLSCELREIDAEEK